MEDLGEKMKGPSCRFCNQPLTETFADLGMSPLSNAYIRAETLQRMEPTYPLHAQVCSNCLLVQLQEFESPERIFTDYAYFSSYSDSWLRHCESYARHATEQFGLNANSLVVEVASNDGYLLQYFKDRKVPVLGIEPAENVARVAVKKGIPTCVEFFGVESAQRFRNNGISADLIIGNNVLAHVPNLNGFVEGLRILLRGNGVITMEFPHLLKLIEQNQFDTIYHEHFSYFSFHTVEQVFARHGLTLFRVEELPTHGGSLRIFARHDRNPSREVEDSVSRLKEKERKAGLLDIETYRSFAEKVRSTKRTLLEFLIAAKSEGKRVVAYGAAAKGNTLFNYSGVRTDFIDYVVDGNPHKQGLHLPGSRIPIKSPDSIRDTRPDYVMILPWNIRSEITEKAAFIREWGGKFVVPVPRVEIF